MNHCNSSTPAPWSETARAHWQEDSPELPDPLVCELVRSHADEHGDHLGNMGRGTFDVWVRWDGDTFTYVTAAPCEVVAPTVNPLRQEACTLFAEHPPGHSWEFEDLLHG